MILLSIVNILVDLRSSGFSFATGHTNGLIRLVWNARPQCTLSDICTIYPPTERRYPNILLHTKPNAAGRVHWLRSQVFSAEVQPYSDFHSSFSGHDSTSLPRCFPIRIERSADQCMIRLKATDWSVDFSGIVTFSVQPRACWTTIFLFSSNSCFLWSKAFAKSRNHRDCR